MKFKISRTSLWHREKPCEEATLTNDVDRNKLPYWILEINSLDDLIKFIEKYKRIVIEDEAYNIDLPEIEIYDDYRE